LTTADVAIVGAGFSGIGMAIALKKTGCDDFVVLERAATLGGTWRDNDYPGCACDVPSMLYSFSFEPYAGWTRRYPPQAEVEAYLVRCAEKYGLTSHLRLRTELLEAAYDEAGAIWRLQTTQGEVRARVLIAGLGPLNRARVPDVPGLAAFAGASFHSSAWDHAVDLKGKRVAVVGTGASAIQIVPAIAPDVERLYVHQRTPAWIIPKNDRAVPGARKALRRLRPLAWTERQAIYWGLEARGIGFVRRQELLAIGRAEAKRHLERQVADPALRARLSPNYQIGCKRVLLSDDFYPALQQPNVELVSSPVACLGERSIVAADGSEREVDAVVWATGFQAADGIAPVRIYGRGGVELGDAWRDGMEAYLGISVAGFPNLFMLVGPNTGLGHNSMIVMIEAQIRYVASALDYMRRNRVTALDVRPDVQRSFNGRLQERMARTVWSSGCGSWYLDKRGKNTTIWPGFTFTYRRLTRRIDPSRYAIVGIGSPALASSS